ncbi:MAG: DUF4249 family protein [Bacteroidota bacterium]
MRILFITLVIALLVFGGCEESDSSFTYDKQIVVTGLIEAGRQVDSIRLVYTGDPATFYDPANYAIKNAVVIVSGIDVLFNDTLVHDPLMPGRYHSSDSTKIILPTKSYRLSVKTVDGKTLSAETIVPDTFRITYSSLQNNTSVVYNPLAPVNKFEWSPSRLQGTYLPTISSMDPNAARIQRSFFRDTTTGPPPDKIGYRVGLPKDQTSTELPWIVLGYYGTTRFDVYAVDNNYNDFLNQFVASQGGELREIRYNVRGGLGFFGARTQAFGGITVYINPLL